MSFSISYLLCDFHSPAKDQLSAADSNEFRTLAFGGDGNPILHSFTIAAHGAWLSAEGDNGDVTVSRCEKFKKNAQFCRL